jgi:hypothetical protein
LFGQSGDEVGKKGKHFLTLLAGFEGNPVQRGEGIGPVAIDNAGRWWSRYGLAEEATPGGPPTILYAMGSGEAGAVKSLEQLQQQSRQQKQTIVALTLELVPAK